MALAPTSHCWQQPWAIARPGHQPNSKQPVQSRQHCNQPMQKSGLFSDHLSNTWASVKMFQKLNLARRATRQLCSVCFGWVTKPGLWSGCCCNNNVTAMDIWHFQQHQLLTTPATVVSSTTQHSKVQHLKRNHKKLRLNIYFSSSLLRTFVMEN